MGLALMSFKPVNPNSLPVANSQAHTRKVVIEYLVIDKNGDGDDVRYKTYLSAVWDLMTLSEIGPEIEAILRAAGVHPSDDHARDCLVDNHKEIEELALKHGYRILSVLVGGKE